MFKCTVTVKKSDEKSNENIDSKKADIQEKKDEVSKDADSRSTKSTSKKPESERGRRDEKRIRSWDHHRSHTRSRSRERRRRDDVLTFAKIRVIVHINDLIIEKSITKRGREGEKARMHIFRRNGKGKGCGKERECFVKKNEEEERIWSGNEK